MGFLDFLRSSGPSLTVIDPEMEFDRMFLRAADDIYRTGNPSIPALTQNLGIGYAQAWLILHQMEAIGLVGPDEGRKPRKMLLSFRKWRLLRPQVEEHIKNAKKREFHNSTLTKLVEPTCGNISILSSEEMLVILRKYDVVEEFRTKVRGVTFSNDNGTSRQSILAYCNAGDQLRFTRFTYQGDPAYAVHSDWGQIGNLAADLAGDVAAIIDSRERKCLLLGQILNVTGGDNGKYFGCNISVTIYERNY